MHVTGRFAYRRVLLARFGKFGLRRCTSRLDDRRTGTNGSRGDRTIVKRYRLCFISVQLLCKPPPSSITKQIRAKQLTFARTGRKRPCRRPRTNDFRSVDTGKMLFRVIEALKRFAAIPLPLIYASAVEKTPVTEKCNIRYPVFCTRETGANAFRHRVDPKRTGLIIAFRTATKEAILVEKESLRPLKKRNFFTFACSRDSTRFRTKPSIRVRKTFTFRTASRGDSTSRETIEQIFPSHL